MKNRRVGDYILGSQLASGGMGVVYEAHQVSLNRKVALKFIRDSQLASPALLCRFTIEAEAAARLHHPNIVRIHEIGDADGQPYFSMDLIEGESLKTKIEKDVLAVRKEEGSESNCRGVQVKIARLLAKTAHAVHHAHQRGVLHRDLKPANIVIDAEGEPHLTDFGLAKILRDSSDKSVGQSLTRPGDVAGTPNYMAPEQIDSAPVTPSADIYGLGAILYELLTGRPPFQGPTHLEILRRVKDTRATNPRSINPLIEKDLETICMKCLEKAPHHRYASAQALARDLEHWIERKPICARPVGPLHRSVQWSRRNPLGTAFIGALLLGFAIALIVLNLVQHQKRNIQLQQSDLFNQVTGRISDMWADTNVTDVPIESRHIAILAGRPPSYAMNPVRVVWGMSIYFDPVSFAQWRAVLVAELEQNMSETLGEPVALDLRLFKDTGADQQLLAEGKADFMSLEPVSYVRAKAQNAELLAIAVERGIPEGVIAAKRSSGLTNLIGLRGNSVAFPDTTDPLTVHAKALLLDSGIRKADLLRSTNITNFSSGASDVGQKAPRREAMAALHNSQFHAAVMTVRRFELERHRGLVKLGGFLGTPRVFVARAGLERRVVDAFQSALIHAAAKVKSAGPGESFERFDWDEPFPGAVAVKDSDLDPFCAALRKAALFDGLPPDALPFSNSK